jgi:hypothetical protein
MPNYYVITIFVVLLAGGEATDKAQLGSRHLPGHGAAASGEGQLAHQRSRGMVCDVRVMGIHRVQSPLRAKSAQPMEQGVGAPLWGRQSRLQDPETGIIHSFSLFVNFSY